MFLPYTDQKKHSISQRINKLHHLYLNLNIIDNKDVFNINNNNNRYNINTKEINNYNEFKNNTFERNKKSAIFKNRIKLINLKYKKYNNYYIKIKI